MNSASSPISAPRSPFDDAMSTGRILFSFRGRVPRKVYWLYGVLGPGLVSVMSEMMLAIAGMGDSRAELLTSIVFAWPCVAVTVKRCHDRDKSGWWTLLLLVPVLGILWALVRSGMQRGTAGPNRFGPDLTDQF